MFLEIYDNYEIVVKAKKVYGGEEKEMLLVVEAKNSDEAKKQADRQLKKAGYKTYKVVAIKNLGRSKKTKNLASEKGRNELPPLSDKQKKTAMRAGVIAVAVAAGVLAIAVLVGVLVFVSMK